MRVQKTEQHQAGTAFSNDRARSTFANVRAGFTLIEVIVVLVIVAILAAIAVPALTGYIEKANDTQWEARARELNTASKTVLTEDYAKGIFHSNQWTGMTFDPAIAFADGDSYGNKKIYSLPTLSTGVYGVRNGSTTSIYSSNEYEKQAAALLGETYPLASLNAKGYWQLLFISPDSPNYNALTADGFAVTIYPEGTKPSGTTYPVIFVTYKLAYTDGLTTNSSARNALLSAQMPYDSSAGLHVYHLTN
jgi:prepilin-type N-terminal cleavage/methylation domain-containing protein